MNAKIGSFLVVGILGSMAAASTARANATLIPGDTCTATSTTVKKQNGGVINTDVVSHTVECGVPLSTTVPNGAFQWQFGVQGKDPKGGKTTCGSTGTSACGFMSCTVTARNNGVVTDSDTTTDTGLDPNFVRTLGIDTSAVAATDATVITCKLPPSAVVNALISFDAQ